MLAAGPAPGFPRTYRLGGAGPHTELLCGAYAFDGGLWPALRALHAAPARPWTVAELARQAGVSRATLARRFRSVTGQPPLAYLAGWRMELAKDALGNPGTTVASVGRMVGYADEFSFAAAFRREVGVAPGRYRSRRAGRPITRRLRPRTSRTGC